MPKPNREVEEEFQNTFIPPIVAPEDFRFELDLESRALIVSGTKDTLKECLSEIKEVLIFLAEKRL
ncbi:MAG: hypothetical protein AAF810_05330 [Cyanobacteria bacterium P01_D01_bin.36]